MRVALNMPLLDSAGVPLDATGIATRAKAMEDNGFAGIWLGDSFTPGMTRPDPLMWLLVAAAATERIEVGTSILIVPLRDPVELAQRFLTLQALTHGRFTVGVGAGSTQNNYEALGLDFDARFKRLNSHLKTIRALCNGEQVGDAFLNPWPSVTGGPPIVVGAWHSGIWLERSVRSYDGWMCSAGRTNFRTMKEAIARYRDLGGKRAIISSCMVDLSAPNAPLGDDESFHLRCGPEEAAERLHRVQELGFDDVLLVKLDHTRSRLGHADREPGRTLSIYEADYRDGELEQIRSLLPVDPRGPWDN